MANTTYNIRIDSRIRTEADELFRGMGLSLSSAINLFLAQSVIQRRLPITEVIADDFEPVSSPPPEDEYVTFDTLEELQEWLNA